MSTRPRSTRDLVSSERWFTAAMQQLGFGRFEFVRIEGGEIVVDPRPSAVSHVKFGAKSSIKTLPGEFELKAQVTEFFEYVRAVGAGEIRTLEIQHGLPFSMEIEHFRNERSKLTIGGKIIQTLKIVGGKDPETPDLRRMKGQLEEMSAFMSQFSDSDLVAVALKHGLRLTIEAEHGPDSTKGTNG